MHPELEQILKEVIKNVPGAYLRFKQKQIELKGGCNYFQFVEFISQQQSLIFCDPEALLDLGYIAENNHWFFTIPPQLQSLVEEQINNIDLSMLYTKLKNAAVINLGALGAILHLLEAYNKSKVFDVIQKDARNEFVLMTTHLANIKKVCPANQRKFLHYVEGLILFSKLSDTKDKIAAKEKFETAAELGLAIAHNACGALYEKGDDEADIEQDYSQALYHYENAEKQHHAYGCYNLGWMLENGYGVKKKDIKEAIQRYKKSSYLGCPEAQYHFAFNCEKIKEVKTQDQQTAFFWYDQAIKQNFSDAQFEKGWLLQKEKNMPAHLLIAAKLFLIAATQDDFKKIAQGALSFLLINREFHPDEILKDEIIKLISQIKDSDPIAYDIECKQDLVKWLIDSEYTNDAIELLEKLIDQYPANENAYLEIAKAYRQLGNRAKAIAHLKKIIIDINKKSADALKELIRNYDEINEYQNVIKYCETLLSIDEVKYYKYNHFCANAYVAKGDKNSLRIAIHYYDKYIDRNKTNPHMYMERACVHERIGNRKHAADDRKSAEILRAGGVIQPTPLLTQQSLMENQATDALITYLRDLYLIQNNNEDKQIIILQLKPINEIVELLTNHIKKHFTLPQFVINNHANLNNLILIATQNALQKLYKNIALRDMKIEVHTSSIIHKTNGFHARNDLINLVQTIINALPEYAVYAEIITIKVSCEDQLQKIKNLEKKYSSELEQIITFIDKQKSAIDLIKAYNGNQQEIRQLIKRFNTVYHQINQFISMSQSALKAPQCEDLTQSYKTLCENLETQSIANYQKFLRQLDSKISTYNKLSEFNKKTKCGEILQCINEFNRLISLPQSTEPEKIVDQIQPPAPRVIEQEEHSEDNWHLVKNNTSQSQADKYVEHRKTLKKNRLHKVASTSQTPVVKNNVVVQNTHGAQPKQNGTTSFFKNPIVMFKPNQIDWQQNAEWRDISEFLASGEKVTSNTSKNMRPIGSERHTYRSPQS